MNIATGWVADSPDVQDSLKDLQNRDNLNDLLYFHTSFTKITRRFYTLKSLKITVISKPTHNYVPTTYHSEICVAGDLMKSVSQIFELLL